MHGQEWIQRRAHKKNKKNKRSSHSLGFSGCSRQTDANWSQTVSRYLWSERALEAPATTGCLSSGEGETSWLVWGLSACGSLHSRCSRWPFIPLYPFIPSPAPAPRAKVPHGKNPKTERKSLTKVNGCSCFCVSPGPHLGNIWLNTEW